MKKRCCRCKEFKEPFEFYKQKAKKDGLQTQCKICFKLYYGDNVEEIKKRNKIYRDTNKEYYKNYKREYNKTEKGMSVQRLGQKRRKDMYPEKIVAVQYVNNAIRDGRLFRKPCEVCGSTYKIEAHHEDYLKPLEVNWLCKEHHTERTFS